MGAIIRVGVLKKSKMVNCFLFPPFICISFPMPGICNEIYYRIEAFPFAEIVGTAISNSTKKPLPVNWSQVGRNV